MKDDFIPRRDGDLYSYESNYARKIMLHGPGLGLDAEELADFVATIEKHMNSYSKLNSKKSEAKSATEENRIDKKNAKKELRRMAQKIKSCKNYNTAIGDDLEIIGTDLPEKVLANMKPVISAVYNGNVLVIKFRKKSTSGINIYSRRGSETEFAFLGMHASSPFNDNRIKLDSSIPEARHFYAMYIDGDKEIGQPSDIMKVIVP